MDIPPMLRQQPSKKGTARKRKRRREQPEQSTGIPLPSMGSILLSSVETISKSSKQFPNKQKDFQESVLNSFLWPTARIDTSALLKMNR